MSGWALRTSVSPYVSCTPSLQKGTRYPCFNRRRARGAVTRGLTGFSADHTIDEPLSRDIAVVIVDHGSRKKESNCMLVDFCDMYKRLTRTEIVEPAHMEIATPTIKQAIAKCVQQGAKKVMVVPYFLSRGRHVQVDIPQLVQEAQADHPDVPCVVSDPIGLEPLMVAIIHQRVQVALQEVTVQAN